MTIVSTSSSLPSGVHWIAVDVALQRLRNRLSCVAKVAQYPLNKAAGLILSRAVIAKISNPVFTNSAVDGYGIRFDSLKKNKVHRLKLQATSVAAGDSAIVPLKSGYAVHILTGARVPEFVDSVILQENVRFYADFIEFDHAAVQFGGNVRQAGEDVKAGTLIFDAGHKLQPYDLALLAATGIKNVHVYRPLRIGVLSTGNELIDISTNVALSKQSSHIFDANRPMLLDLINRWGGIGVDLGINRDSPQLLRTTIDNASDHFDALITSGGVSSGDMDYIAQLLAEKGQVHSWRIAMKPGRPLNLAFWNTMPVFGLPGNPVAAFVTALIFVYPAFGVLSGQNWLQPRGYHFAAAFSKVKRGGRREYLRARLNAAGAVEIFAFEGSGRIRGLSWSDGLVHLSEEAQIINKGSLVQYYPYRMFGL